MVTPLFTQLFCYNLYVSSKNEAADLMKTVQLFNCLKAFKVLNQKFWEQALWMTLICVMIRNLWLIMGINCKFLKECKYLNCTNSYNICPCVKLVQIGCEKREQKETGGEWWIGAHKQSKSTLFFYCSNTTRKRFVKHSLVRVKASKARINDGKGG